MAVVESSEAPASASAPDQPPHAEASLAAGHARALIALIVAGAVGLSTWGIHWGLPFSYHFDEHWHFSRVALRLFDGDLNPHYFANPPAFTYLLHVLYRVFVDDPARALASFTVDASVPLLVARATVAALFGLTVWLVYRVGLLLFDRTVGLIAAALLGTAFLPVFQAHIAVNDVPALAPMTLALLGAAGIATRARVGDFALAGLGLGGRKRYEVHGWRRCALDCRRCGRSGAA